MLVQKESAGELLQSLASLQVHFNNCFRKDVLIFHSGTVSPEVQYLVSRLHPQVRFHVLKRGSAAWPLTPPGLQEPPNPEAAARYAAVRWHTLAVFDYVSSLGYELLMRMDPTARLLSCVDSDPFQLLEAAGRHHAYRLARTAPRASARGLPKLLQHHAGQRGMKLPPRVLGHFSGGSLNIDAWDRWTYDAGWMLTRVAFWKSPEVRAWLQTVDASQYTYRLPITDATLQTLTLKTFMKEEEELRLSGWSYRHDGALAVAPRSVLPSVLSGLLPRGYEWLTRMDELREHPRYKVETQWVSWNIIRRVNQRDFWNFRFLKYVR